jgi:RNA polymerase sigma-70 factor, ECF subfamily
MADPTVQQVVGELFSAEWGRLTAQLIGWTGDWDLAEECVQDAFALALRNWPSDGIPDRPGGWLLTVARRRAIDRIRHQRLAAGKLRQLGGTEVMMDEVDLDAWDSGVADQRLRLIFTCCHPALSNQSQVTLALRTLLGLEVSEIARAFGVTEAAMAKQLTRTRSKIRDAGIPYRVPPAHLLPDRMTGVLAAIYLLANEGYVGTESEALGRPDLWQEALRLASLVAELMPDDPEALGLNALLLLHAARAGTRTDATGTLIPLEQQDRDRWSAPMINKALELLGRAARRDRLGPYQVQAMIAACHLTAGRAEDTDWSRIVDLYDTLLTQLPAPTVQLNRIIAIAMRDGPEPGLRLLDEFASTPAAAKLPAPQLLAATRADLLRRLGRPEPAADQYRIAIDGTRNTAERRYLERRLAELSGDPAI